MRISLVIPAYNEEQYIGGCLESVFANAPGKFSEVIVVDNASTDKTAKVAGQFPDVRVVHEREKGLPRARERGREIAGGELIAYLDADTRMPKGWIEKVLDVFEKYPKVVSLSGPARYWDANFFERFILALSWWVAAPLLYTLVGYMIYGAHFVVRKSALDAIGGFNRSITFYGEDTDLARRLSKIGKVLFRMDFFIYSSVRRFRTEGILRTNLRYSLNFLWPVFFGRQFTKEHRDIR